MLDVAISVVAVACGVSLSASIVITVSVLNGGN